MAILREKLIEFLTKLRIEGTMIPVISDIAILIFLLFISIAGYFAIKIMFNLTIKKYWTKKRQQIYCHAIKKSFNFKYF